jgi:hypothetical protein
VQWKKAYKFGYGTIMPGAYKVSMKAFTGDSTNKGKVKNFDYVITLKDPIAEALNEAKKIDVAA